MKNKKNKKGRCLFKEAGNYVGESKNYILFATLIFLLLVIAGFIFPTPDIIADQINKMLEQIISQTAGLDALSLILFILKNNALVSIFGLFLGMLAGVVPFILAVSNGYVLGYVLKMLVDAGGISEIWKLFPHGIFELPAILISLGLGMRLGMSFFAREPGKEFLRRLWLSAKVFIFIVLPLLIIAAIIEGMLINFLS